MSLLTNGGSLRAAHAVRGAGGPRRLRRPVKGPARGVVASVRRERACRRAAPAAEREVAQRARLSEGQGASMGAVCTSTRICRRCVATSGRALLVDGERSPRRLQRPRQDDAHLMGGPTTGSSFRPSLDRAACPCGGASADPAWSRAPQGCAGIRGPGRPGPWLELPAVAKPPAPHASCARPPARMRLAAVGPYRRATPRFSGCDRRRPRSDRAQADACDRAEPDRRRATSIRPML
jgi:hypothetical protein